MGVVTHPRPGGWADQVRGSLSAPRAFLPMSQALIGIGLFIVLLAVFVLTYRHREGGCTGTGDCGSCHGGEQCSSGVENEH